MSELNARQKLFCKEYLIDLNASAAYKRAGYSARGAAADVNASKLLRNTKVAKLIQESMDKRAEKLEINAEYVLGVIKNTIERCSQAEQVTAPDGSTEGVYKFDAAAVLKGAELLGKHLKLFTDKQEVKHEGGITITLSQDDANL